MATPLRLLTLNANAGFDLLRRRFVLHRLREAVHAVDADVVCLQEVLGRHAGHAARHRDWPEAPQYEFLADRLWPEHAYARNAVFPEGELGNAVLSRYPIVSMENRDVSLPGHEPRGLLHCRLALPGREPPLHVVCVHFGLLEAHRRHQARLLVALLEELPVDAPVLVAGDFNDWRGHGHRALRGAGLEEVFERTAGRIARTFPAALPVLRVDRIYVRGAGILDARVLHGAPWTRLSDHLPLLATLALP